jgi:hypothetical protein
MAYRLEHITTAERVELGCASLLFAGQYGLMSGLARDYGTSRQFLYTLRARTRASLEPALAPGRSGRPAVDRRLVVDGVAVARAVLVLHQVAHASVRGIQECLAEILRVRRSPAAIQATLAEAAERARALRPAPAGPLRVLADEIFAGRRPALAAVDHASGLVVLLEAAERPDETAWGCAWLDLAARGVPVASVAADAAAGLAAGARAAGLGQPRLDHWHTLRDLGRVGTWLEGEAYRRLAAAERARRAATAARYAAEHGHRPRAGRPLRAPTDAASVAAAAQAADAAITRADGVATVLGWVRAALRPIEATTGQVRSAAAVVAELGAAASLLRELGGRASTAAGWLEPRAAGLVGYLDDLASALAEPRALLGEAVVTFLAWTWQHRRGLDLRDAAAAWPHAPILAQQVWAALDGAVRGTGMVENLNSLLACHRAVRRGLPPATLALFAAYRNHRCIPRGKRAGHSPLELAGLPSPHWLDPLGYSRTSARVPPPVPAFPTISQTVNTLAA